MVERPRPPGALSDVGTRRARLAVLAVLGAGVLAAGAGLQADDQPEATAATTVPARPATTTTVALPSFTDPMSMAVLVDRDRGLPPGWVPPDLVAAEVPFTFAGDDPKRLLRAEAASALEGLFADAAAAGVPLRAVSGYRSEATQADLYDLAVHHHGRASADRTNARPGHSEHQTGLAMDVTGADGRCPAEACFGTTPAARWLVHHAPAWGFVVRYPAGKEAVTGYGYEPWHLRYVGARIAAELVQRGITLDELASSSGP
ncbi:MAG: peptidase [Actinomycetia bacterium]|nr:peptidase [Actinomycetes bacterium]